MAELLAEADALFADERAEPVEAAVVDPDRFGLSGFAASCHRYCKTQLDAATLSSATAVVLQQPLAGTETTVYWMLRDVFSECGAKTLLHDWLGQDVFNLLSQEFQTRVFFCFPKSDRTIEI